MSEPKQSFVSSKGYRPDEWPMSIPRFRRDEYEHIRCRGFTEEEVRRFKQSDSWKAGQYVEKPEAKASAA